MIAICPAGPPKLMNPNFNQKRKASAKLTGKGGAALFCEGAAGLLPAGSAGGVALVGVVVLMGGVGEVIQSVRTPAGVA
jgi:hypothetical protein